MNTKTPICLVTGFLGSGKTTLLKQIIKRFKNQRLIYLINEFSVIDVDSQLLKTPDQNIISIPGGSIFCRCLAPQFIDNLKLVHHLTIPPPSPTPNSTDNPYTGLVIEASGIANPKIIQQMLVEAKLDTHLRLARVITVIDPATFHKLLATLPNITAQVEAADLALINKSDLHTEAQLNQTRRQLLKINPALTIINTKHSAADFDLFPPDSSDHLRDLTGEYAKCVDPNYCRVDVSFTAPLNIESLKQQLSTLNDNLYRVKGFIQSGSTDNWIHFDHTPSATNITPQSTPPHPSTANQLIFIAHASVEKQLNNIISKLESTP